LLRIQSSINEKKDIAYGWSVYLMLAEIALLKDDRQEHEHYIEQAKTYFEYYFDYIKNPNTNRDLLAYEARNKLWNGNTEAAREWLSYYFVGHSNFSFLYKVYKNFTTVRAYIVLGESGNALKALEEIKSMAEAFDRPLDAAEADVLISITHWGMGKKKEAKERLLRLLIILYPRNFIRVIANEGKAILPVLQSLMKMLDRETERGTAFCQYIREVYLSTYAQSKRFRGITSGWREKPVKLSPQQKYVFALLSKGYKNAEIVKIAGLRLYTIKSYTRIIYQKLEVHNLMDAIIKAKQLGILK